MAKRSKVAHNYCSATLVDIKQLLGRNVVLNIMLGFVRHNNI